MYLLSKLIFAENQVVCVTTLSVHKIGVLRHVQKYFTYTTTYIDQIQYLIELVKNMLYIQQNYLLYSRNISCRTMID